MKAIIMAGGSGTRIMPLTAKAPKPMIELFGKPLLEHTLERLGEAGFTDVCITLRHLPAAIMDRFGDGRGMGLSITYMVEERTLGTAGSVRACAKFIGGDDFLVASGD